ncbi:hypothetical protein B296_00005974 [Ensete ventricosum]|uniref:Uncharacterized protein n=1 Tax=Ensete ventricosum TaxID=4639 RepID=A0A426ZD37_ENSVE|nr:hypothetical protein B296_00005974 [Ensete ventricosum]
MKMQAPRTSRASLVKGTSRSLGNAAGQQALIAHWQGIVKSLDSFLNTLKANHVSLLSIHIAKFLFMYAGSAWDELKHIRQAIGFLVMLSFSLCSAIYATCRTRMAVIHQKPKKTLDEISHDLCPVSEGS